MLNLYYRLKKLGNCCLSLIFIIALWFLLTPSFYAFDTTELNEENILIVHSYHKGFPWTDALHEGILSDLSTDSYNIYIEYLDAYRKDASSLQLAGEKIAHDYAHMDLFAILVTDNSAYDLVLSLIDPYFKDVPILFAGVNASPDRIQKDHTRGILQNVNTSDFLVFLQTQMPHIDTLVLVGNATKTSFETYALLETSNTSLNEPFILKQVFLSDLEGQFALIDSILTPNTALYVIGAINHLDHTEYASLLANHYPVPTFVEVTPAIVDPVLGGFVVDPFEHGVILVGLLHQLESGTAFLDLPILSDPVYSRQFNVLALETFGLTTENLPSGSILLNQPSSFMAIPKTVFNSLLVSLVFLTVITFGLIYVIRLKNNHAKNLLRTQLMLEDSNMELETQTEELMAGQDTMDEQYQALKLQQRRLTYLVNYDPLTHYMTQNKLIVVMQGMMQNTVSFTLVYVILQGLDAIAYTFGSEHYQQLLRLTTQTIRMHFGQHDYRYAVLRRDHLVLLTQKPQDLEEKLATLKPKIASLVKDNLYAIHINPAIGLTDYKPGSVFTSLDLLSQGCMAATVVDADFSMDYAKYAPDMRQQLLEARALQKQISMALDKNDFILYLQPKFHGKTLTCSGFEALIRWPQQDGSIVNPNAFIPLAEKTGQIIEIGCYVIEAACSLIEQYNLVQYGLHIAVNLSIQHFYDLTLIDYLDAMVSKYHIHPKTLELEITETHMATNPANIKKTLQILRSKGFRIAMDDFGTGYSALSQLHQFPLDKVKIDRSFIIPLPEVKSMTLVEILIHMCQKMSFQVIIEGVESQLHIDLLSPFNPTEYQGFFFDRPGEAHIVLKRYVLNK